MWSKYSIFCKINSKPFVASSNISLIVMLTIRKSLNRQHVAKWAKLIFFVAAKVVVGGGKNLQFDLSLNDFLLFFLSCLYAPDALTITVLGCVEQLVSHLQTSLTECLIFNKVQQWSLSSCAKTPLHANIHESQFPFKGSPICFYTV